MGRPVSDTQLVNLLSLFVNNLNIRNNLFKISYLQYIKNSKQILFKYFKIVFLKKNVTQASIKNINTNFDN